MLASTDITQTLLWHYLFRVTLYTLGAIAVLYGIFYVLKRNPSFQEALQQRLSKESLFTSVFTQAFQAKQPKAEAKQSTTEGAVKLSIALDAWNTLTILQTGLQIGTIPNPHTEEWVLVSSQNGGVQILDRYPVFQAEIHPQPEAMH